MAAAGLRSSGTRPSCVIPSHAARRSASSREQPRASDSSPVSVTTEPSRSSLASEGQWAARTETTSSPISDPYHTPGSRRPPLRITVTRGGLFEMSWMSPADGRTLSWRVSTHSSRCDSLAQREPRTASPSEFTPWRPCHEKFSSCGHFAATERRAISVNVRPYGACRVNRRI
eukprot:3745355-Prymnesium_polylepis.1